MSQDIKGDEDFKTRLDLSTSEPYGTRRDTSNAAKQKAEPTATRRENSRSVGNKNAFIPPTSIDSESAVAYQRVRIPQQLASDYENVEELIAKGAEADLLVIREKATGQKYILKLYRKGVVPKEKIAERIKAIGEGYPEYFIQLVDYFYSPQLSYEILEYLEEGSLADFISEHGGVNENQSREIFQQLSDALDILHKGDIIHRDLKPSNVLIRQRSPLKLALIDFGISSLLDDATRKITSLNATTHYASPEALSAGDVSTSSDFWSLGIMIVELLTGKHPFSGLSEQVVKSEISQRSIDISAVKDARWRTLCQGLLLRDSRKRWGNAELSQWLSGQNPSLETDSYQLEKQRDISPYKFCGENYCTPQSLAVGLATHWDEGVKRLLRGDIRKWLEEVVKDQDLYNSIFDIEKGIHEDKDLKLLLAISRLNPDLEPTYREHSLTEEGLLAIADSENLNVIDWLYESNALSIYGEHTQIEKYSKIDQTWRESILQFVELLDYVKTSKDVTNDLDLSLQGSSPLRASLLKYSVSTEARIKLVQIVKEKISPEAQKCTWFNEIVPDNIEKASVSVLNIALLIAPIAKISTERENKQHIDSYLRVVTFIKETIARIESRDKKSYQLFPSTMPTDKLMTASTAVSRLSLLKYENQLSIVTKELSLIHENANSFIKERKYEVGIKVKEADIEISSLESKLQNLRKLSCEQRKIKGSYQKELEEFRDSLSYTGYYQSKRSSINRSSKKLSAKHLALIVMTFSLISGVVITYLFLAFGAPAFFVIIFLLPCLSLTIGLPAAKNREISKLLRKIEDVESSISLFDKRYGSDQRDTDALQNQLTAMNKDHNAYKKELKDLSAASNSIQSSINAVLIRGD